MAELKDNYVLDTPYTWGFYEAQSPTRIAYAGRLNGVAAKPIGEPFTYCELGCGNGLTSNVLAASLPHGEFYAVDLNPEHVANGRRIAEKGGLSNVTFIQSSFEDLLSEDLPQFDYITLQGVYSWVSAEVRGDLVKLIDKFLKPGGLVYNGYNALPGWASQMPLRQIMLSHTSGLKGGSLAKAAAGLRYLKLLRDNGATYFKRNPDAGSALDRLLKSDLRYVVHEFFNESWQPQYFSEVAAEMAQADLNYCGTTTYSKNYSDLCLPKKFRELLGKTESAFDRETHKSLILNERFRADVFFRGSEITPQAEREHLFDDMIIGALVREEDVKRAVQLGGITISYTGNVYNDLVPALVEGKNTVAGVVALPEFQGRETSVITKAINNFVAGGQFQPFVRTGRVSDPDPAGNFRILSDFNRLMLEERLLEDNRCVLASEVLGNGVAIGLVRGLLLCGIDAVGPDGAVDHACARLKKSGKFLRKDGKAMSEDACREAINAEAVPFFERLVPVLHRLGIVEECGATAREDTHTHPRPVVPQSQMRASVIASGNQPTERRAP